MDDVDAAAYVAAVAVADGQPLEPCVRVAVNTLVKALKAASFWASIRDMALLAGPRTAAGAMVPLKGTAPSFDASKATHERSFGFKAKPSSGFYIDTNVNPRDLPVLDPVGVAFYAYEWQFRDNFYVCGSSDWTDGGLCFRQGVRANGVSGDRVAFLGEATEFDVAPAIGRGLNVFTRSSGSQVVPRTYVEDSYATGSTVASTITSNRTATIVPGTIRIGSAPPAAPGESMEAHFPFYFSYAGTGVTQAVADALRAYRHALQAAIPPAAPPPAPVFKAGWSPFYYGDAGGAYCYIGDDTGLVAGYRVYVDGARSADNSLIWDAARPGLLRFGTSSLIGKTVEVATWNGKGETKSPPYVIATATPPA